jgi:hypothetical protein
VQNPGNTPAGSQRLWGDAPGSEVSLGKILEHRVLQVGFCQQLHEPGILLLHQDEPFGLLDLHAAVLLPSAVVRWLRQLDQTVVVGERLALGDKILSSFELADDLLRSVHGGVSEPVCPNKDSHSPWTDKEDHVTTTPIANFTTAGKKQTKSRHKA